MRENNPAWKGGVIINSTGYRMILKPEHPRCSKTGYVLEHVLVVEEYISRISGGPFYIEEPWVIHHINRNKLDNRLENLQMMTRTEHATVTNAIHKEEIRQRWATFKLFKQIIALMGLTYMQPELVHKKFEQILVKINQPSS